MTTTSLATFARTRRGAGPGLLLAHGAGGGVEANYGPIMEGLAAQHTVVGVDYPGTGDTPVAEEPLDADQLVDQLLAAADAEGLDTFAVSGYSLGGPVAIRLAARYPERVEALVLTATLSHADTRTDLAASLAQHLFETGQHAELVRYLNLLTLSDGALNALTRAQVGDAAEQMAATLPLGTGHQLDLVRRIDVRGDLAGITVPTLVVVTTADSLVLPALQRDLAAAITTAEVAELPVGHLPFLEAPQRWAALISDFLARARRSSTT
jgi:3-oxoadipate enol-lactonase